MEGLGGCLNQRLSQERGWGIQGWRKQAEKRGMGIPSMMAKGGPRTHCAETLGHQEGCGPGIKGGLPSWKNDGQI